MAEVADLLERPIYGVAQVDRLLGLSPGTARRWIDGYRRAGKDYPPVVRIEPTGEELVTWGEFVETRLLSEYRDAGVPLIRMRPAIDRLREQFHPRYPLAHSRPFLDIHGRELVLRAQEEVGLERELLLVVVRNEQIVLSPPAEQFVRSAEFDKQTQVVERLRPVADIDEVVIDPSASSVNPSCAAFAQRSSPSKSVLARRSMESPSSMTSTVTWSRQRFATS
ncbi:MAG: hypothetical protein M5U27_17165 [Gaiella sp.]|nr:hypothetical protein [Gaiella sp.]